MADPFVLLVLHHSHTDVGYTETPQRIERWHADFIRQALGILEARPAFRWVCETFWGVEQFLQRATPTERQAFAKAVQVGRIGLSASYLNFSELAGAALLKAVTARASRFGAWIGAPVRCAMTADINGSGWGFADALLDAGAEFLFTCVHTHHGRFPLGRTQIPFSWETPEGRRLTVWSGEHYHLGNELGLVPGANSSYLIKDECDAETIFSDHRRVAETRIRRYVEGLCARDYPFDFAPVMASGLRNDNAPPHAAILDAIEWWNEVHGDEVHVRMATLEDVHARLKNSAVELPVYRGDWPDWWSDGPSSRPRGVRLFRKAQRDFERVLALRARYEDVGAAGDVGLESIETELALFAEHTFSHSDACSSPWIPMVAAIDATKDGRAARALALAGDALDAARETLGGSCLAPGLPLRWRVVNATTAPVFDVARLGVGHYEFEELGLGNGFEVRDTRTGATLPCQLAHVPRGGEVLVPLSLDPGGERWLELVPAANGRRAPRETPGEGMLETDHVLIELDPRRANLRLFEKAGGRDLVRADAPHAAFQLVRDVTPVRSRAEIGAVRGRMGLNRKGEDWVTDAARYRTPGRRFAGEVFDSVILEGELDGTAWHELEIRAHRHAPRVDVLVRFHKTGTWEPENVYVALPFAAGPTATTWIEKAGVPLRPGVDQIPGTLTDYYAVPTGFASVAEDFGVVVLMPDQHLLQLGPLAHGERRLAGDPGLADDPRHPYGWLMTNYWETNFAADLGGFYEMRTSLLWGADISDEKVALARAQAALLGLESIRLAEVES